MRKNWCLTVVGVVGIVVMFLAGNGFAQTVVTPIPYHNPGGPVTTVCGSCPTCSGCQMVSTPRMNCGVCPSCAGCQPAPNTAPKVASAPSPAPKVNCAACPTCEGCNVALPPPPPRASGTCTVYPYWNCAGDRDCDCIPDSVDKCVMDKENYNGVDDKDGCPDKIVQMVVIDKVVKDTDNDGIVDDDDRCPFEPEDRDGFKDEDGCPDGGIAPHYKEYLNEDSSSQQVVKKKGFLGNEYLIHVGSFNDLIDAMNEAARLHDKLGIKRVCVSKGIANGNTVYRTIVGPFRGMEPARKVLDVLLKVKWVKKPRVVPAAKFENCMSMKF